MTFVLHFYAIYDETTSTAHGGNYPDSYKFRLSYQTCNFRNCSFFNSLKGVYLYHLLLVYLPE